MGELGFFALFASAGAMVVALFVGLDFAERLLLKGGESVASQDSTPR